MTHRLAICLAVASLTFVAPRPADAAITSLFDTVDAVESTNEFVSGVGNAQVIKVTGILVGGTVPTTQTFTFAGITHLDQGARCERLALLAMSKPGKYQFGIGSTNTAGTNGGCKLILRTP
jgi:hypothetical protein